MIYIFFCYTHFLLFCQWVPLFFFGKNKINLVLGWRTWGGGGKLGRPSETGLQK